MHQKSFLNDKRMHDFMMNESQFQSIANRLMTEDGLVPFKHLHVSIEAGRYHLSFAENSDINVFPLPESTFITNCLVEMPHLWSLAQIRVGHHPRIFGSAPSFGPSFKQALEITKKGGHTKLQHVLPETYHEGRCDSLLVHLCKVDDIRGELLQLEAWQHKPGDVHACYLHALSPDFEAHVVHFDGARIIYNDADLNTLLNGKKTKGHQYTKFFRFDGEISIEDMHILAKAFLPGTQLYSEALQINVVPDDIGLD
ncbi:hypothetical protein [Herminiimonas aquatilis]|uniref:Uncharacterized protein n=1 Tax=Herminiimonas aquatilis TaxID=345342 RepID=A0ABW2J4R8_9BURK